ncbi:MAG: hypothetical protein FJ098_15990, partial [Deltaproteobacteria bacterium]|nr:hypothetical protein [Deltaproteobacteria bacterium]
LQCQAAGSRRLLFSTLAWGDELAGIPPGTPVAVYAASPSMETVLVGGPLTFGRRAGIPWGRVEVDRVYNSMPPAHGPVFPPEPLAPVTRF